jgi:Raf kinase inhibitor-like YbhB/YbcL family protein
MNPSLLYQSATLLAPHQSAWLTIDSSVFRHGGILPALYRSEGMNVNPSLDIKVLPESTKSLVVMLLDADAPISARVHWICWDLPPTTQIQVNEKRGTTGVNDFQLKKYVGPCVQEVDHKYYFIAFALDSFLHLPSFTSSIQIERSMKPHMVAVGSILFFSPPVVKLYE